MRTRSKERARAGLAGHERGRGLTTAASPFAATSPRGARGEGSLLPELVRARMESALGADFSRVCVHDASEADTWGAAAAAQGEHVFVRSDAFDLTTVSGSSVLAHELAHIVQQRSGRAWGTSIDGTNVLTDPALEAEADEVGARAARGEPSHLVGASSRTGVGSEASPAPVQLHGGESDYLREVVRGGRPGYTPGEAPGFSSDGPNDAAMAPKSNPASDTFNSVVNTAMGWLGYDTTRRPPTEDNDFYRDYAQYMPGFDIDGIPSGAWAQNAATNHVGHGTAPGNPWDNVRRSLVDQEKGMIDADLAAGGTGKLSYWDLYDAHVNAYDSSGGGGNGFIDPGSFALAVYGAPLLEACGIDSGPVTGASIDIFNNPEDSATEGWAKRMGLAGGEMLGGMGMFGMGAYDFMTGSPLQGGAEMAGGVGLGALGAFGAGWNTVTAFEHGMLDEWGSALGL